MAFIPVGERPLAYIDVETTGLDPLKHEIVSIALVFDDVNSERYTKEGLSYGDGYVYYHSLIKPQDLEVAEAKALEINGYAAHPEKWSDAPSFNEVAEKVARLLDGTVPVGHNVTFDTSFIQEALRRAGNKTRLDYHRIDTCNLVFEHLVPAGIERLSLDTVRDFMGWDKTDAHTALRDALDARRVYKTLSRATWLQRWWWSLPRRRPAKIKAP